ncbi:MAG: right-handed parallel beta-helix repeat-containing protein [Hyphomicrobiales bacterium]
MPNVFSKLLLVLILLFPGTGLAQISVGPESSLGKIVQSSKSGETLVLSAGSYSGKIDVLDKTLSIEGTDGLNSIIQDKPGSAAIPEPTSVYVNAGADLSLNNVRLSGSDAEQVLIHVDGGSLSIRNSQLDGPVRFAIYAAPGSRINIENVRFEGEQVAVFAGEGVQLTIRNSKFSEISDSAIYIAGQGAVADLDGVSINKVGSSAILGRDGAIANIRNSTMSAVKVNAVYLDNGAALSLENVAIRQIERGLLAFNPGKIDIQDSQITEFGAAGISLDAEQRFGGNGAGITITNLIAIGNGPALSTTRYPPEIRVNSAQLRNQNQQLVTIHIANAGPVELTNITTNGGYAGVLIEGERFAATRLTDLEISGAAFAGIMIKNASAADRKFAPVLDRVRITNLESGMALALEQTEYASVTNSVLIANDQPVVTSYQSGELNLHHTILATGADNWLVGEISHNGLTPSRVNIIEMGAIIESSGINDTKKRLLEKLAAATAAAKELGKVAAVAFGDSPPIFGDAVKILIKNSTGPVINVAASGVSTEVPSGDYSVTIDGVDRGKITVESDGIAIIPIPEPHLPYLLYWDGDKYVRGRAVELLDRKTLRRNYQARGVVTLAWTRWNSDTFGIARKDLTEPDRAHLLDEARKLFFTALDKARRVDDQGKIGLQDYMRTVWYSSAVMAALGTIEDRNRILDNLQQEDSFVQNISIEVASYIEARLELVDKSRLLSLAQENVTKNPSLALRLATASAIVGNANAVNLVIELVVAPGFKNRMGREEGSVVLALMGRSKDPRVLEFFRDFLTGYKEAVAKAVIENESLGNYRTKSDFHWPYSIPMILEYVAAWGSEADGSLLAVPISGDLYQNLTPDISSIVKDPVPIYMDRIGALSRPVPINLRAQETPYFGQYICQGLERRPKQERERILDFYENSTGDQLNKALNVGLREGYEWKWGQYTTAVTSSYCNPTALMAELTTLDDVNRDRARVFLPGDQALPWITRPLKAKQILALFDPEGGLVKTGPLSQMSVDQIAGITNGDPRFETAAGKALLLNHRALSYEYQEPNPDVYPNGADRRLFLKSLKSSWHSVLTGRVQMKPVIQNGLLRVGLGLQIAYHEGNGLAARIGRTDEAIAKALAVGAFEFIKSVTLRRAGQTTKMTLETSTKSDVHIFSIPFEGSSLANLSVEVELGVMDDRWTFTYPLFVGDFAFRHRTKLP